MVKKIRTSDADYLQSVDQITAGAWFDSNVVGVVEAISRDVAMQGDEAVLEYTKEYDGVDVAFVADLKVSEDEVQQAYDLVDAQVIAALEESAKRIEAYHVRQLPEDVDYVDDIGVRLGNVWKPIDKIGLYVPGGKASYPSSVLMNAVPAKVANVGKVIMVVPAPNGVLNPVVLAAAKVAGVNDIYKIGGAQAVAALAYGTSTVPKVDKIVGPGNVYVAAAKKYFYGIVGVDMIAGPSEILVVADNKNNPEWIAADLLSQAEHDECARSILLAEDEQFVVEVEKAIENILQSLDRQDIARESWQKNGLIVMAEGGIEQEAVGVIDKIAPEHLELALDDELACKIAEGVSNAGAIFLGRFTPEAIGDYIAGPSHVLPTSGTARFASGLSVYDFMKRVSLIGCNEDAFGKLAEQTKCLADSEQLGAHALSISIRNSDA